MRLKIALLQEAPVFLDREKTLQKVADLTQTYARKNCQLIVFPEAFIPGYPRGFSFGTRVGSRSEAGRDLYAQYFEQSLSSDGEDVRRLAQLAIDLGVYLIVGATERVGRSGSLYCSMFYFSPVVGLLGIHRKIKPTGQERVIWGEADGRALVSFETTIGRLGGLICWENYMPLARMAMYRQGVELYIAPTADARSNWTATMRHIALEGRCFVLGCNQYFTKSMYPEALQAELLDMPEVLCRGGSVVVSPFGEILAGPLFDEAGGLVAEIDLADIPRSKLDFDVIGHYARDDIFQLQILQQPPIQKEQDLSSAQD
ncbi:MAG: carbon-nitrogen hydrolase family protein [Bacteroidota bacterium]